MGAVARFLTPRSRPAVHCGSMSDARRDNAFVERLAQWFRASARDLPWRATDAQGRRNPYFSLVSETMLQQTQVARVIEKFDEFTTRFPTIESLARARESSVLAAWSGLGYYRRARHLHGAAKEIAKSHQGQVPHDIDDLIALPGVGRYTAGAIASIVFDQPAPIVDGNVARVLLRIEGNTIDPRSTDGSRWLWNRAAQLAQRASHTSDVAAFNEGMMELGATICTPRSPKCGQCPVASLCRARRDGLTGTIPPTKKPARVTTIHHDCLLFVDARGRRLVRQRSDDGLWAGMWQPPTLEGNGKPATKKQIETWLGAPVSRVAAFEHLTSHRRVKFRIWRPQTSQDTSLPGDWRTARQIERLALSNPHRRILLEL